MPLHCAPTGMATAACLKSCHAPARYTKTRNTRSDILPTAGGPRGSSDQRRNVAGDGHADIVEHTPMIPLRPSEAMRSACVRTRPSDATHCTSSASSRAYAPGTPPRVAVSNAASAARTACSATCSRASRPSSRDWAYGHTRSRTHSTDRTSQARAPALWECSSRNSAARQCAAKIERAGRTLCEQ